MKRVLTAPGYIYSAALGTEHLAFFENQYLKFVDRYDDSVAATPERKEMAKKIGYAFFHNLKRQWEQNARRDTDFPVDSLGDKGFDWHFLSDRLNADSIVYGVGLGTNVTFEVEMARRTGARVHCFDPTPQAGEHMIPIARAEEGVEFHPVGVFSVDGVARFYKPVEKGSGSLSATNLTYSDVSIDAPVRRLRTIMTGLGHDRIDYFKIDIEGAEHGVIEDMLFCDILPDQVAVEFDMPVPPWTIEKTMRRLFLSGYELVDLWGLNCLFVKSSILDTY